MLVLGGVDHRYATALIHIRGSISVLRIGGYPLVRRSLGLKDSMMYF